MNQVNQIKGITGVDSWILLLRVEAEAPLTSIEFKAMHS